MQMYVKKPEDNPLVSYFIHPFNGELWIAIICWILGAIIIVTIIQWKAVQRPENGWLENIGAILEAFCNQGGNWNESFGSARLSRLSTWITVGVVFPSYTAVIISFMTIRQYRSPFDDIYGLAVDGRFKISADINTLNLLELLTVGQVNKIISDFKIPESELPYEVSEASKTICGSQLVYIGYGSLFRNVKSSCEIVKIGKPVTSAFTALLFTYGSPFAHTFNKKLTQFYSNGMLNRFQKEVDRSDPVWDGPETKPVEFELVKEIIIVFAYVPAVSVIVLFLELLWIYRRKILKMNLKEKFVNAINRRKRALTVKL